MGLSNKPQPSAAPLEPQHQALLTAVQALVAPLNRQNHRDLQFRRWKFTLTALCVAAVLALNVWAEPLQRLIQLGDHSVNLVRIDGPIMAQMAASPERINPLLVKAFEDRYAKAVVLAINSPGGTPVAANAIRARILELRARYPDKEVIAIGGDYLTSGAYLVATAAQEIFADEASIVGSIGVVIRSFGFSEVAKKVGVERRVLTAGENKAGLDAWLPLHEDDRRKYEQQLARIHQQFIAKVKASRGDRLTAHDRVFSGDSWTGEEALALGLIDGLGQLAGLTQARFGTTTLRVFKPSRPLWQHVRGVMSSLMMDWGRWASTLVRY